MRQSQAMDRLHAPNIISTLHAPNIISTCKAQTPFAGKTNKLIDRLTCNKTYLTTTYLLSVPAACYWLIFVILKDDPPKLTVRDVLDKVPLDRKGTTPPIPLPEVHSVVKIYPASHLCHATKPSTPIDLYTRQSKKVNKTTMT